MTQMKSEPAERHERSLVIQSHAKLWQGASLGPAWCYVFFTERCYYYYMQMQAGA